MNWTHLHTRLARQQLLKNPATPVPDVRITGVSQDSRNVQPGHIFVAVQGQHSDGAAYIQDALEAGAVLIVAQHTVQNIPNFVQVQHARKAAAVLAAAFHGDPAKSLHLTGITGTNGKTTTGTLMQQVLQCTGTATGLIGTVTYTMGQKSYPPKLTTPDATELQPMLAEMVRAGCQSCVIEVSSHALDQDRTATLNFSVGVFTNLMHDHLDYHKTAEHYLNTKKRLFDGLTSEAVAVYNQDDQAGKQMIADSPATRCSYGQATDANIQFRIVKDSPGGLQLCLDGHTRTFRLSGAFNAYNLAAAYGAARATGLSGVDAIDALSDARPVSGRFEQYLCDDATRIIIDFAHTPDALEQVLRALVQFREGSTRIWCVFGCGGNRDERKRPRMGAIAERLADQVIITSDNPRNEPAQTIADAILNGMHSPHQARLIPSRPEAIRYAAQTCNAGDIVLVAGKGHETVQIEHAVQTKMNDQDLILEAFASRNPQPLV